MMDGWLISQTNTLYFHDEIFISDNVNMLLTDMISKQDFILLNFEAADESKTID